MRRRLLVLVAAGGALTGMVGWLISPSAPSHPSEFESACDPEVAAARSLSNGAELATANELGLSFNDSDCGETVIASETGSVRHIAQVPGAGTVFVEDREGPDTLTVIVDGAIKTAPTTGEVTNPSMSPGGKLAWAEDHERIKVWNPRRDEVATLRQPEGTTAVFSPAFVGEDTLAAVGQEPVPGVPGEDDGLNNLFEVKIETGTWEAVTDFEADPVTWTALRTPVTTPDGNVVFVRVRGVSTATEEPSFELWESTGEGPRRLKVLPTETYLAGFHEGALRYNAPSDACDDWGLYEESADGLRFVGCGAVLADPLNVVDPDLEREEHSDFAAPPAHAISDDVAVVIGDFRSRAAARRAALQVGDAPGQRISAHRDAPGAVAPGAWAVVRPVPEGTAAEDELARVRRAAPALAAKAFLGPIER